MRIAHSLLLEPIRGKMSTIPGSLSLGDLAKIIEDIHDAVDKWHNIGIQLGLHESDLKSIESNYPRQNDRLREMVCKWLQGKNANWGKMVTALKSRTVGEGYLAEQLVDKYCKPAQITVTTTKVSRSTEVSESVKVSGVAPSNLVPPSPSQSAKVATGSSTKSPAALPVASRKRPVGGASGSTPNPKKVVKVSSDHKVSSSFSDDQFVKPQPSELHCVKCKGVPELPKRSKCCNTLYCEPCSLLAAQCPVHKSTLEWSVDSSLKSRIAKWTIYCLDKCGWKGPVHKLKEHMPQCSGKKPVSTSIACASPTPTVKANAISVQSLAKTSTTSKATSITFAQSPQKQSTLPQYQHSKPPHNILAAGQSPQKLSQPSSAKNEITQSPSVQSPQPSKPTGGGHKSSSVSVDTLYSELKGICAKWHKLGAVLKINYDHLEEIRKSNGNNSERCLYALLKELVGIKGGCPYKKLCKALESDIVSERALVESLKSKYGASNVRITLKATGGAAGPGAPPSKPQQSEPILQQQQQQQMTKDASPPSTDPDSFYDSDFVNPLPPELHCMLCKKVPRKPRRSKCCNTLYCEPCSKKQEVCPAHKQKKEYSVDSDLRNKVSKIHLRCLKRCGWKGTWTKMKEHLKECGKKKSDDDPSSSAASTGGEGGAGSMTITELTTTTTQLHTKTTTINQSPVGGAVPGGQGEGGVAGVGQRSSGVSGMDTTTGDQFQQPLIQYRDRPKMDLLYLIKYASPDGQEHTLKLVDKLAPFWKRMGSLLGIDIQQLTTWELTYANNPSYCSEAVLSYFLSNGSQGTYVYPRTWGGIVKLLLDVDLKAIAEEIQSIAH